MTSWDFLITIKELSLLRMIQRWSQSNGCYSGWRRGDNRKREWDEWSRTNAPWPAPTFQGDVCMRNIQEGGRGKGAPSSKYWVRWSLIATRHLVDGAKISKPAFYCLSVEMIFVSCLQEGSYCHWKDIAPCLKSFVLSQSETNWN